MNKDFLDHLKFLSHIPKDECLPAKEMKQPLMLLILIQQETSHEVTLMTLLMRNSVRSS